MLDAEKDFRAMGSGGGETLEIVAVAVGNTNTKFGLFRGHELRESGALPSHGTEALCRAIVALADRMEPSGAGQAVVIASVNSKAARPLREALAGATEKPIYQIGPDLPIPLRGRLDHEAMTGHDRALNALAAYEIMNQAVVVVDAGTAITVDFVDGEGVFHGGAIAPGVTTALKALHSATDALPEVPFVRPDPHPFGANTQQAMLNGVFYGARGLVRALLERYAEAYSGFPLVVATGGDAEMLFGDDELVDRVIPNLTLLGIVIACERALHAADE